MKKNNDYKQKVKYRATEILTILDIPVYISPKCPTLLRIGHTSKLLEASPKFKKFDIKQQEFAVKATSRLLSPGEDQKKYYKADSEAFSFMIQRYPKINKVYWIDTFVEMLGKNKTTKLNINRIQNLVNEETI
jgi:hypothetical protein